MGSATPCQKPKASLVNLGTDEHGPIQVFLRTST